MYKKYLLALLLIAAIGQSLQSVAAPVTPYGKKIELYIYWFKQTDSTWGGDIYASLFTTLHRNAQMSHDRFRSGINSGIKPDFEVSEEKKGSSEVIEKEWCRRSESNRHGVAPGGF